ncbi:hypothetical protein DHD32_10630 [Arenibacter sp. TNZ]|jgi:uncharacterized protein with NRDE domain|uniref:NRDE family protein n=1 Tax=Arenibacter TaxID=178469 RepID=UPI000CD3C682|nr:MULTISPECIES: NRDE family protein [Arenibacter]MCM4171938.1 hypothetical protein [Arenibacter sp. TNZ]
MCTVSFISHQNKSIITSNRDEHVSRPTAFYPNEERINNYKVIYPKDPKGKGTWFAIREDGVALVLLNGAFQKHIPKERYAMSRGLVLLKIIGEEAPETQFAKMNLIEIEPFTLIFFNGSQLLEFRWDGSTKHRKELKPNGNYIWSSVTLYNEEVAQEREQLFEEFLKNNEWLNENSIVDFHLNNNDDFENGFVIDRNNGLQTVSITQAVIKKDELDFTHFDLLNAKTKSRTSCLKLYN